MSTPKQTKMGSFGSIFPPNKRQNVGATTSTKLPLYSELEYYRESIPLSVKE